MFFHTCMINPRNCVVQSRVTLWPLSPDLLKIFIQDLASLFKHYGLCMSPPEQNHHITPDTCDMQCSDDLVIVAFDPKRLQNNVSLLFEFLVKIGLDINIKKNKIVIFGHVKQKPLCEAFKIGDFDNEHASKYCYLGMIFHQNRSFTSANAEMRANTFGGFCGLKNHTIKDGLSTPFFTSLSWVQPILLSFFHV